MCEKTRARKKCQKIQKLFSPGMSTDRVSIKEPRLVSYELRNVFTKLLTVGPDSEERTKLTEIIAYLHSTKLIEITNCHWAKIQVKCQLG
jgi:hypothetical protein